MTGMRSGPKCLCQEILCKQALTANQRQRFSLALFDRTTNHSRESEVNNNKNTDPLFKQTLSTLWDTLWVFALVEVITLCLYLHVLMTLNERLLIMRCRSIWMGPGHSGTVITPDQWRLFSITWSTSMTSSRPVVLHVVLGVRVWSTP